MGILISIVWKLHKRRLKNKLKKGLIILAVLAYLFLIVYLTYGI